MAGASGAEVEGIYHRAGFLEQRRELLEKWADYRAGSEPNTANIVPLKRAAA